MSRTSRGSGLLTGLSKLALGAIALGAGCFVGFIVLTGKLDGLTTYGVVCVVGIALATALAAGMVAARMSGSATTAVVFELAAFVAGLVFVELFIAITAPDVGSPQLARARDADKLRLPFDSRTKSDVVAELRSKGVDALPGISREWPRLPYIRQQLPNELFPLSHASLADIVECNESGRYLVYQSDEFGFNNPRGLLAGGHIDVAAVGASFTLGHCVPAEQSLIGQLRQVYPRTGNFGLAGSGTLSMLGTLREYVAPLKPALVLWIMHPWTADTRDEAADPILVRYLEPAFSQDLMAKRELIDATWRELAMPIQHEFDRRNGMTIARAADARFARVPYLQQVRDRLNLVGPFKKPAPDPDLRMFYAAIAQAQRETEQWGGTFVVVIMPLYAETIAHELHPMLRHERLKQSLEERGVAVIDTVPTILAQRDPRALYTMRRNNHPNPAGYKLLADEVKMQIAQRFAPRIPALSGERTHE
jgi:hypothetical protein